MNQPYSLLKQFNILVCLITLCMPVCLTAQIEDTVIVDLNHLTSSYDNDVQTINIPVYYNGTNDEVNAIDFWFQFNLIKLTYISTTSSQIQLDAFTNFNDNNEFLSNTSSTSNTNEFVVANSTLMELTFQVNDPCATITLDDFVNASALLNGDAAAITFTSPAAISGAIEIIDEAPFCSATPISMTFVSELNGQNIETYNWDFGVSTGSDQTSSASFPFAGTYNPQLNLTTEAGCLYFFATELSIIPSPEVSFDWTGELSGENIVFTNSSAIPDGSISGYNWDFGDTNTSTETDPTHIYTTPGLFDVTLTATSNLGCTQSVTQEISIISSVDETRSSGLSMTVYPNPTALYLHVRSTVNIDACITDAGGRIVIDQIQITAGTPVRIDVSQLPAGLYSIQNPDAHRYIQQSFIIDAH